MSNIEFVDSDEIANLPPNPEPEPVHWHHDRGFTVGRFGSLAETMGWDEADAFLDEFSLTRATRRGVIRRMNEQFRKDPHL
jgi:hypothetical protein